MFGNLSHRHCIFIQTTIKANIIATLHNIDCPSSPLNSTTWFLSAAVIPLIILSYFLIHLQRCCCRCRLPSSRRSCRWGRSDTAGNHSVCPSPCRAERHQTAASLIIKTTWLLRRDKNKDNDSVAIVQASPQLL